MEKIGGKGKNTVCPTEHVEQSRVVSWCRAQYGPKSIFAIPNTGKMSYGAVNHFRTEGRSSGVPDLFIPGRHGIFLGLFIEMKRERGGVTSQEQAEWIEALKLAGYYACVCRGFDEAVRVISEYKKVGL
ncbi:MAG: VRR-NUC domain-containing protein [Proteobacteria bacterium]|nr:VRR-NUC domain-containing protein [Pseudomonadota bacterium]